MAGRREYESEAIRVLWDSSRCIHTAICLQRLPQVFDVRARPWIDLEGADPDAVAAAIEGCPTGALRYDRLDGSDGEVPERPTTIVPIDDGPLLMIGDLEIEGPDGEQIGTETRVTLCRCGMSRNKPFCDNSHLRKGWRSGPSSLAGAPVPEPNPEGASAPTKVLAQRDASLRVCGDLRLQTPTDDEAIETGEVVLCRCGKSESKPFCDGSHEKTGFRTDAPAVPRDRLEAESPAAFTPNSRVPDPRTQT